MLDFDVVVIGDEKIERSLRRLSRAYRESVLRRVALKGAEPIRDSAQGKAPVRRGRLAANIVASLDESTADQAIVKVGPAKGMGVYYGRFQEWGTEHHAAQPFLRPAIDERAEEAIRVAHTLYWQAAREAVR